MDFHRPLQDVDYGQRLWEVKYAPRSLDEITGNAKIITLLRTYLQHGNIPNLIISGPPGVGKKSAVRCLVRQYLGSHYAEGCLGIDGSINRGKDVVSDRRSVKKSKSYSTVNITSFIKQRTSLPEGHPKIIIIYDFDYMTDEAQMALRRIIEIHAQRVRFIFVSNDHQNIIEAIQSRCQMLTFSRINDEELRTRLLAIVASESVPQPPRPQPQPLPAACLDLIILISAGDLKQAINVTQAYWCHWINSDQNPATAVEHFYQLFGVPYVDQILKLYRTCQTQNLSAALQILQALLAKGFNSLDVLDILLKLMTTEVELMASPQHTAALEAIAECYYQTESTGSLSHLYALVARLTQLAPSSQVA